MATMTRPRLKLLHIPGRYIMAMDLEKTRRAELSIGTGITLQQVQSAY